MQPKDEVLKFVGSNIFTLRFLLQWFINTASILVLIHLVYYPRNKKREFNFTFFILNFVVFLLAYILFNTLELMSSLTGAFGIGAAFALLRFRTEQISIKDMTYLFIILALGVINAVMKGNYLDLVALNLMIIGSAVIADGNWFLRTQNVKVIEYDSLDNIQPAKQPLLLDDLKMRTGLNITRIEINNVDFVRKRAEVKIYYYE